MHELSKVREGPKQWTWKIRSSNVDGYHCSGIMQSTQDLGIAGSHSERADCWEKEILQQTTHRLKLSTKSRVGGIQVTTSFPFHTPREIQSPSQTQNVGVGRIYKIRSIGDWAEIPR